MSEQTSTYSQIISPEDYNELMTNQHLYIAGADRVICRELVKEAERGARQFVEVGCGPARLLRQAEAALVGRNGLALKGLDHDEVFLAHARSVTDATRTAIEKVDLINFNLDPKADIFFSQGFHHHIGKGGAIDSHLRSLRANLSSGGVYVLGDEFLPEYDDEEERKVRAVIWYAHIIDHAAQNGHTYLAREEAKTLLDDINLAGIKSEEQIGCVLRDVAAINAVALTDIGRAEELAENLLKELRKHNNLQPSGDLTMDLSRGDFKISESVLRGEMSRAGFEKVELIQSVGPYKQIGALAVYKIAA